MQASAWMHRRGRVQTCAAQASSDITSRIRQRRTCAVAGAALPVVVVGGDELHERPAAGEHGAEVVEHGHGHKVEEPVWRGSGAS